MNAEWIKKWWFLILFGISAVAFYVKHETDKKEMQITIQDLKEDMNAMPGRVINEWKAYLFEKQMKAENIERGEVDTINLNR